MRHLTEAQREQIRQLQREWQAQPAPCGIDHDDVYNPCLPQRDGEGPLYCCTCGMTQVVADAV